MLSWKRRFIVIWAGQLFSILSSTISQFAIVLWISLKTESASVLAVATIAALLPQIILGPIAGVYVDRWNRKSTMIAADSFIAVCSAVLGVMFFFDSVPMWALYLLLMLRSVGNAFHSPAFSAAVPMLAPKSELTRVAGVNQALSSIGMIAGPALGALLVVWLDMGYVMLFDVVGAAIAVTTLLFVTIPEPKRTKQSKTDTLSALHRDINDGYRAIRGQRGLSALMVIELVANMFFMPMMVILPLLIIGHFGGGAYEVGLAETTFGVGALLGSALISTINPRRKLIALIAISYILFGLLYVVCGLLPSTAFIVFVVVNSGMGVIMPFYSAPFTALLQLKIESSLLGRVFAIWTSLSLLPAVIGLMWFGGLVDLMGVTSIFVVGGVAVVICGAIIYATRSIRLLDRE